jgi:hypothetical protein
VLRFLKKKVNEGCEFGGEHLSQWPSVPGENNVVPSLQQIIDFGGESGVAASILESWCTSAKRKEDSLELQAVVESKFGLFTIPGIIQLDNSKEFVAYYSNKGEWSEASYGVLLQWLVYLRTCDFVHNLKVVLCEEKPPSKAREMISSKKEHRMLISMIPHIQKDNQKINARVFSECFAFFCHSNKLLNYDEESLQKVEDWYTKDVKSTNRDSYFFSLFVRVLGAYAGQVIISSFNAEWESGEWPVLKMVGKGGAVRINIFQLVSDYVCNPQLKTSLVKHVQLIKVQLK